MSELKPDTDAAIEFLKALDPDGVHNLVAINPERTKGATNTFGRTFAPNKFNSMRGFIEQQQAKGRNVYYSVNEPAEDAPNKKLLDENISRIRALVFDADPKPTKPGESYLDVRRKYERDIEQMIAAENKAPNTEVASLVVDSGGGFNGLFVLDKKVKLNPQTHKRLTGINRAIARELRTDGAVIDASRILRLPGTINFPDKKKQALGRKPALARTVHIGETRVTLDEMQERYGLVDAPVNSLDPKKEAEAIQKAWDEIREAKALRYADFDDLPDALREKFTRACDDNYKLADIWKFGVDAYEDERTTAEGTKETDKSGSGLIWRLVTELKSCNTTFTAAEAAALIWTHPDGDLARYCEEYGQSKAYRQVARAWARNDTAHSDGSEFGAAEDDPDFLAFEKRERDLYKLMTLGEAANQFGDITWLVRGLLPLNGVGLFLGARNAGKSFGVLDCAHALANRRSWLGKKIEENFATLIIVGEGFTGLGLRTRALQKLRGDAGNGVQLMRGTDPFAGRNSKEARRIVEACKQIEQTSGKRVGLIVFDTMASLTPGKDENAGSDMSIVLSMMQYYATRTGAAVAGIHHTGKDTTKGARGWSGIEAAMDFVIKFEPDAKKERHGRVHTTKERDAGASSNIPYYLHVEEIGKFKDGEPITSCVFFGPGDELLATDADDEDDLLGLGDEGVKPGKGALSADARKAVEAALAEAGASDGGGAGGRGRDRKGDRQPRSKSDDRADALYRVIADMADEFPDGASWADIYTRCQEFKDGHVLRAGMDALKNSRRALVDIGRLVQGGTTKNATYKAKLVAQAEDAGEPFGKADEDEDEV